MHTHQQQKQTGNRTRGLGVEKAALRECRFKVRGSDNLPSITDNVHPKQVAQLPTIFFLESKQDCSLSDPVLTGFLHWPSTHTGLSFLFPPSQTQNPYKEIASSRQVSGGSPFPQHMETVLEHTDSRRA